MKTFRDLIETLPEHVRQQATANVIAQRSAEVLDTEPYIAEGFLTMAFSWARTPEGHDFWEKVNRGTYENNKEI